VRLLFLACVVAGCHPLELGCPSSPPSQTVIGCNPGSLTCAYDDGQTTCHSCADSSSWVCDTNTCPWDGGSADTCTTDPNGSVLRCTCGSNDTTCEVFGFESCCSCTCEDYPQGRYWNCFNGLPSGFSSACPSPPADAGVD
jgi:hypothetical protein